LISTFKTKIIQLWTHSQNTTGKMQIVWFYFFLNVEISCLKNYNWNTSWKLQVSEVIYFLIVRNEMLGIDWCTIQTKALTGYKSACFRLTYLSYIKVSYFLIYTLPTHREDLIFLSRSLVQGNYSWAAVIVRWELWYCHWATTNNFWLGE